MAKIPLEKLTLEKPLGAHKSSKNNVGEHAGGKNDCVKNVLALFC